MNFLNEYPKYCGEITDAPPEFHQAVGLGILASACGSNFYFPFGDNRIYPNLYLILMGSSSDTRKSTALQYGKNILQHVKSESIHPNEFSHERLLQILQRNPAGVFFYSEFLTLMGLLSRDYMQGTKAFLTEIYDCPPVYKRETIGGDPVEILSPVLSIITATTVDWFLERLSESDIMGGFLIRFLLIFGERKNQPIPIPPPVNQEKKAALIKELRRLSKITGVASLTPDARRVHDKWYRKLYSSVGDFRYGAFFHRHQIYLLKISMLIELSESQTLKISEQSMNQAIDFINWAGRNLKKIGEDELVFNKFQRNVKTIKKYLSGRGKVSRSQLIKNTRLSRWDADQVIKTLLESDELRVIHERDPDTKRTTTHYETSA